MEEVGVNVDRLSKKSEPGHWIIPIRPTISNLVGVESISVPVKDRC